MGIILSCSAEKVVNKGGGFPTKTVVGHVMIDKEGRPIEDPELAKLGRKFRFHRHLQSRVKSKGSDYVVFVCPGCGKRNKRCVYEVKGRAGNALSFKCNGCLREIEVDAPVSDRLVTFGSAEPPKALVGPDGRPV